ncbi:MAG TPA: hypothetical protein VF572_04180 [Candidatus Saccharimonadales bacterium]|jgi:hypothetical protein
MYNERLSDLAYRSVVIGVPIVSIAGTVLRFTNPESSDVIPLSTHNTSIIASVGVGYYGVAATVRTAGILYRRGYEYVAERMLRGRQTVAALGATAYQLSAESGAFPSLGVADQADLACGLAAIIPAVMAGEQRLQRSRTLQLD